MLERPCNVHKGRCSYRTLRNAQRDKEWHTGKKPSHFGQTQVQSVQFQFLYRIDVISPHRQQQPLLLGEKTISTDDWL